MKHAIETTEQGLDIRIEDVGEQRPQVLAALQACAEGRCACPTPQYAKLDAIAIRETPQGVAVTLRAKTGETIDAGEVERCLDWTAGQAQRR